MNVVLTGKMSASRAEITKELSDFGVIVDDRIARRTDVLITGAKPGKTKIAAANNMNVTIMSEGEWRMAHDPKIKVDEVNQQEQTESRPPLERQPWMDDLATDKSVRF